MKSAVSSWQHKFYCLSGTNADRVPTTSSERMILDAAGLGERVLTVPDVDCSVQSFRQLLLTAYPKLRSGGGFELLRCKPKTRDLVVIGSRCANCPRLLKRRVGHGKVYIRPIQRDLCLDEEEDGGTIEEVGCPVCMLYYYCHCLHDFCVCV